MMNAKRILITTESHEIFIVRPNENRSLRQHCKTCEAGTEMLTLDEAVTFAGMTTRELMRRVDSGSVHSIETENGHLLICSSSL